MTYNPHGNYPSKNVERREQKANETPTGTSKELIDWVGEDPERAQRILDQENASDKPRKTVVEAMEKLLDDTSSA
jgi:hypothetical protein